MKKFLFLGYELPVMPFFNDPLIVNEQIGTVLVGKDRLAGQVLAGSRSAGLRDLLARATHYFRVFETAQRELFGQDQGSNTLPIFMAPEFYFRQENSPYAKNDFYALLDYFKLKSKLHPKWMFVIGTVWWGDRARVDGKDALVVHNSTAAIRNNQIVHTYLKQLPSDFDKLLGADEHQYWDGDGRDALTTDLRDGRLGEPYVTKMRKNLLAEYNQIRVNLRKSGHDTGLFTCDGVRFGIEVCLDHAAGVLKQEIQANKKAKRVDVHLVSGCGMSKIEPHIMCRTGGYYFRVDGHKAVKSEVCKIKDTAGNGTACEARGVITGFDDAISKQLAARASQVPEAVKIYEGILM